jgi:hypothetical protein
VNVPGMSFLRERSVLKRFESQEPSFRDIVFYSEGAGDWPHLGPVIEAMLRDHDRNISYLTSDPADPGLALEHPRLRTFQIGSGTVRTILFARIDVRHFVMTLPDLGRLWLKRSVHPVHYVYLFHSMNSTHTSYRKGAFDEFNTILCVGPYQVDEIRKTESLYGLPAKELVEHGSAKLDTVLGQFAGRSGSTPSDRNPEILVAPTWGDSSLIERPVGRELLEVLLRAGHRTTLRLHPMTVRRLPRLVAELRQAYRDQPLFHLEEDMSATASWLRSSLMVSDWSGAAIEYAFALQKPVIYLDTPPKIMNPDWSQIGAPAFEDVIRKEVGRVVDPSAIADVPRIIADALSETVAARDGVLAARLRWVYNVGESSDAAARYLEELDAPR